MSRKQRRKLAKQREKALKEGRRYSNFADEHTAQLKKDFGTYTTNLGARNAVLRQVMEAHPQEPAIEPVNKRVALAYLPDYKRDKKGRPLSKRDARTALEAQKQAEDYLYGTPEAQRAVLDRIVRQMCTVSLNGEMFSPVYIRAHFAELKRPPPVPGGMLSGRSRGFAVRLECPDPSPDGELQIPPRWSAAFSCLFRRCPDRSSRWYYRSMC